ncbi:single-stranded DNA-binding protein [uncultured Porphyromonas sp.]|uniref:single-stranded DNA-binding protein n=1 Tax=uncultured Porphyromonas sp. TaxID=159274 RepID=UPI00261DAF4D|nr:single-stranded DNA-binding protein [uncultured Porphyromonas sp.]
MYYNKAILIGFVGSDPSVHYSQRGNCQASLRLATTVPGYTKRDGTQIPDRTEWHTVVLFGALAQFVEQWVRKGSHLLVEGEIRYNSYTDRQGKAQSRTEIWADKATFVDRPKQRTTSAPRERNAGRERHTTGQLSEQTDREETQA